MQVNVNVGLEEEEARNSECSSGTIMHSIFTIRVKFNMLVVFVS